MYTFRVGLFQLKHFCNMVNSALVFVDHLYEVLCTSVLQHFRRKLQN